MATKTITTNENNGYTARLTVTTGTQSISGNYTPCSYTVKLKSTYATFYGYTIGYEVKIDGEQVAYHDNSGDKLAEGALGHNDSITICSGKVNVKHNADGTKKDMDIYVRVFTDAMSYTPGTLKKSGTMDLPTIARTSKPTCSPTTVQTGNNLTVTTNRESSSFTHTLTLKMGSQTITKSGVGASATINIPKDWAKSITTSETEVATLSCKTIHNGKTIGTAKKNVTIKVNTSVVPKVTSVTVEPVYTKSALNGWGGYLQNYTKFKVTAVANGNDLLGASIKSYKISYGGTTATSLPATLGTITSSGTQKITVSLQDTRGRTSETYTKSISVTAYKKPSLSSLSQVYRSDDHMAASTSGERITVYAEGAGTVIKDKNEITIKARYKALTDSNYDNNWQTISNKEKTLLLQNIAATTSYNVELQVSDTLGSKNSVFYNIPTEKVAIQAIRNSDGSFRVSLGKYSEYDGFEAEMNASFNKDVQVLGTMQPLTLLGSQYFSQGKFGLNLQNSDLYRVNSIYFADAANGADEGLMFARGNDVWDTFRLYNGKMYITTGSTNGFGLDNWKEGTTYDVPYVTGYKATATNVWGYRKWSNGMVECWLKKACTSVMCDTAWGNDYVSGNYDLGNYPVKFSTRPIQVMAIHLTTDSAYMLRAPYGDYSNTASHAGYVSFVRPSKQTKGYEVNMSVYTIGYL